MKLARNRCDLACNSHEAAMVVCAGVRHVVMSKIGNVMQ